MANRAFYRSSRIETTIAMALQAVGHTGSQPGWHEGHASPRVATLPDTASAAPLQLAPGVSGDPQPRAAGDRQACRNGDASTDDARTGEPCPCTGAGRGECPNDSRRLGRARTERELLHHLLQGDGGAWQEFDRRYSRLIQSCIRRATAQFTAIGPDDTQEIQAMLWLQLLANDRRKLRGFEPERGCALSTWIGMLAIHCAYDYLRALRREPVRIALADAERLSSELPDPADLCAAREHAQRLETALECFSARDREFVRLYFGEGLEAEQIAGEMRISVKTVYSKKHKIRLRLESAMAERRLAA